VEHSSVPGVPTVLLVDSSHDDRAMYADYLRVCGFEPTEVDTTDDAVTLAADADVIVTGIRVHGSFDGLELIRRLRRDQRTSSKPILCLTACAFEPDRRRALSAGCDAFLPKPCLPDMLVRELRRALAARSLAKPQTGGAPRKARHEF